MKEEYVYTQVDIQNLIASLPGYICLKNEKGRYIACTDLQAQHLGFKSARQVLGKTDIELLRTKTARAQNIRKEDIKAMKHGTVALKEDYYQAGDRKITLLNQKSPFINHEGKVIGVIYTSIDITEKKAREEQAWILEDIIGKLPGHVWWKDKNLRFLGCNDQQARTVGLQSRHEIKGKNAYDIITKDQSQADRVKQAQKIDKVDKTVIETGETYIVEEELVLRDGRKAMYLSHKAPLKDSSGNIIGLIGTAMDITDHKETQRLQLEIYKAEKKSQEKFITLIDKMQRKMHACRIEILNEKFGTKMQTIDFEPIHLTNRERQILYFLSLHKSPKEIALILSNFEGKKVAAATISAMINKQLYPKFNVYNLGLLIEKATVLNLIPFLPEE